MTQFLKTEFGFTLMEVMLVVSIIALLAAIAIPNYISYRNKSYCSQAEADAKNTASAIADYFGTPSRIKTPSFDELNVLTLNPDVVITGEDPNIHITIQVTDRTSRCPIDYQNSSPYWDSHNVLTIEMSQ